MRCRKPARMEEVQLNVSPAGHHGGPLYGPQQDTTSDKVASCDHMSSLPQNHCLGHRYLLNLRTSKEQTFSSGGTNRSRPESEKWGREGTGFIIGIGDISQSASQSVDDE
jgi:hypothetical protein